MKILYWFCALVLLGAFADTAKADPLDFNFKVLDPPGAGTPVSGPFTLTFSPCPVDPTEGCFYGYNDTPYTITDLYVTFTDTGSIAGQTVTCDVTASGSLFGAQNCTAPSPGDDDFTIYLYDGAIDSQEPFLIEETGADPSTFPDGNANVGFAPEPGSIWLLSSAAAMLGFVFIARRRSVHGSLL